MPEGHPVTYDESRALYEQHYQRIWTDIQFQLITHYLTETEGE